MIPKLITEVSSLVEEIEQHGEGLDKAVLVEAVHVTEFSDPVNGATLLEQLKKEGLL